MTKSEKETQAHVRRRIRDLKAAGIEMVEILSSGWDADPLGCIEDNGKVFPIDAIPALPHPKGEAKRECFCDVIAYMDEEKVVAEINAGRKRLGLPPRKNST